MLKSIDFWPLVPKKLSVESSINNNVHEKSTFKGPIWLIGNYLLIQKYKNGQN